MMREALTNADLLRDPVPREGPTYDRVRDIVAIFEAEASAKAFVVHLKRCPGVVQEGNAVLFTGDEWTFRDLKKRVADFMGGMQRGIDAAAAVYQQ